MSRTHFRPHRSRIAVLERLESRRLLDASAPAILQIFESDYDNTEQRAADIFAAGYGGVWIPPTGRADSGGFSAGYDVYDRFDLGGPGDETLYGTEQGLTTLVDVLDVAGVDIYVDFIVNHNGFRDTATPGFVEQGGYPGFVLQLDANNNDFGYVDVDGDFHGRFETGDERFRLSGLIDVAQQKNYQFVRQPTDPDDPRNLPAGTLVNVPDPSNARFYPDTDADPILVFDPRTGESDIPLYPLTDDPAAGDSVPENALGLIMRNARWMIERIGVDGLRIDAAKHVPPWVLDYIDRAVYRAIDEPRLDGSTDHAFLFSEIYDGSREFLQERIRKDIDPNEPGRVGGNRDALDFPLFFSLRDNLTSNGFVNDWRNIKNASQDVQDDGLANNGSQGVAFASSHDDFGAYLDNVAHAYTLMRPGNAIVYFNAKQFGDGRDFPKDGRGDALGGLFGDIITRLVQIRNSHGRGDFIDRTPAGDQKEMLIFEREASSLVVLSNRIDGGFDSRTIATSFAPGTPLIELTGNAADPAVDPNDDFAEILIVGDDGTVDLKVPRNRAPGSDLEHGRGYFIYGPSGPQGELTIDGIDAVLAPGIPTASTNGTTRLSSIGVVTADRFDVRLETEAVTLPGSIRDLDADGNAALLKINAGIDVNGNGSVDNVASDTAVTGFEAFTTVDRPGFGSPDGSGTYVQTIDATGLAEGMNFVEVRSFRHRDDGGDAVYTSWRESVYIDRLPPEATLVSFDPIAPQVPQDRRLRLESLDRTADNVHVFFNLPPALTDAEVLALVGSGSQTAIEDRATYSRVATNLVHGNHVATVVTFEPTGRAGVQRFAGLFTETDIGAGLGDLDHDGDFDGDDVAQMRAVFASEGTRFNPAADFDGDGRVDAVDVSAMQRRLTEVGDAATRLAFRQFVLADVDVDFGDAPNSFGTIVNPAMAGGGPFHIAGAGPRLGALVDAEPDAAATPFADGDDNAGQDDEDGLVATPVLVPGQTNALEVIASTDAWLDAWIDFDGDGTFTGEDERLGGGSIAVLAGANSIDVTVPRDAATGETPLRLRISGDGGLGPTGLAADGEVEDHLVLIGAAPRVSEIRINDGQDPQRSIIRQVEIEFDSIVEIDDTAGDAFRFTRLDDDATVADRIEVTTVDDRTLVTATFLPGEAVDDRGTLEDGRYRLVVDASRIAGLAGPLDGDRNGFGGDDFVFGEDPADRFFRRFGDDDGNGLVDLLDFGRLLSTFGLDEGDERFNGNFDSDRNGQVDLIDFGVFLSRFGR